MNAAETWVDIYNRNSEKNVLSSIVNIVSGTDKEPLAAHFMSESGIVDVFVLLGETPQNTFKQYTDLTGSAPLPQQATLAYHQCRWNYNDEKDVTSVSENFDVHDIPMDTVSPFIGKNAEMRLKHPRHQEAGEQMFMANYLIKI